MAFRRLLVVDDSPGRFALGYALGIFIAFSPFVGLHTISTLLLATVLRLSKIAVLAGVMVNNPWTMVFIYGVGYQTGRIVLGGREATYFFGEEDIFFQKLWTMTKINLPAFVVGTMLSGVIAAVLSYFIVFFIVKTYQKRLARD